MSKYSLTEIHAIVKRDMFNKDYYQDLLDSIQFYIESNQNNARREQEALKNLDQIILETQNIGKEAIFHLGKILNHQKSQTDVELAEDFMARNHYKFK